MIQPGDGDAGDQTEQVAFEGNVTSKRQDAPQDAAVKGDRHERDGDGDEAALEVRAGQQGAEIPAKTLASSSGINSTH